MLREGNNKGGVNMINHVVLMKFKPDVNDDAIDDLEKSLDNLPNKIVEIQAYEFGRDRVHSERSYDFALVSLFANLEAVKRYQEHPAHLKALQKISALAEKIIIVDFEGSDAGDIKKDEEGAILSRLGRA
jgi:hypothetical protein